MPRVGPAKGYCQSELPDMDLPVGTAPERFAAIGRVRHGELTLSSGLSRIRSTFTGLDGLMEGVGFTNLADPRVVHVYLADRIGVATDSRFDIRWYRKGITASIIPIRSTGTSTGTTVRKETRRSSTFINHPLRHRGKLNHPGSPPNSRPSSHE